MYDYDGLSKYQSALKRLFDILIAVFVLTCIFVWLVPIIWLSFWSTSSGPIFFVEARAGRFGRVFPHFSFRTRVNPLDRSSNFLPIGRFLYLTRLAKLPEFLNVFLGHMSIIGPSSYVLRFDAENWYTPDYKNRYMVKPGIFSLAQTKNASDLKTMIHYDLLYVKNQSLSLDLIIFLRSIANLFGSEPKYYFKINFSKKAFYDFSVEKEKLTNQKLDLTSILAVAVGGLLLGSLFGVTGAIMGLILGSGIGYLSQIINAFEDNFPNKELDKVISY